MSAPTLAIEGLWLSLRQRRRRTVILRDVSLAVAPGEVTGLVGESGAGKSMIARALLNILPSSAVVDRGSIRFEGEELLGLSDRARRALLGTGIALVPQDPMTALNPVYRIERQITDTLRLHLGLDRAAARARALDLLEQVRIREPARVLGQYPHELSGGMRQRVLIAIAFACDPRLIIADEPTTALDVTVQRQILRLIRELQRSRGAACLFVTHDLGVVSKICDRVTVLHTGRVVEAADVGTLFANPAHDYTRALLRATPRYDRPAEALAPVPPELTRRLQAEAAAMIVPREAP